MDTLREEPRDGPRVPRDADGENHVRDQPLMLSTAQRRIAECCFPKQCRCGACELRATEAEVNAQRIRLNQAGHCQCKFPVQKSLQLRENYFFSKNRETPSCSCLAETGLCESGPQCSVCFRGVCSDLCSGHACTCCGPSPRCTRAAQRDIRTTFSWLAGCPGYAEMRASLELFFSVQQLDIVHSLYLLRHCGADPLLPLQFSDGGVAPGTARDRSAGNRCFEVAPEQRESGIGKWGPGSLFCASLAIRAAQRLASVLRSSPLQLLHCNLQSSSENISNNTPETTLDREPQQYKLAETFPPEPCEGGNVFLMRCIFTWGAAASHQLGYEVFSSAMEKLYQPPRCITLRPPEPLNSAAGNSRWPQPHGIPAAVVTGVPASTDLAGAAGANVQTSELPFDFGKATNVTKEGGSSSCSQNSTSTSAYNTTSTSGGSSHRSGPNPSSWSRHDNSNGGLGRIGRCVGSSLQVQVVKCGPSISLAVTLDGKVWVWGKNADGRRRIYITPVSLEGLGLEGGDDLWEENVRPMKTTARGADKSTGGTTEAVGTAAAAELPAEDPGATEELSRETEGRSGRRTAGVGSPHPDIFKSTRKGVVSRVIDAAVGAQHCLLLVDVLRGNSITTGSCSATAADRGGFSTGAHVVAARQERDVGRCGDKSSSRRTRVRRARRSRLEGGTLLPSEPSEMLSFRELATSDEEDTEEEELPTGDAPAGDPALLSATSGSAAFGRRTHVGTAAPGERASSSLVTERRLYVWGSNGFHQLGFPHSLSQAARYRVDIVSSPHASTVDPCATASFSSDLSAELSWTVFPHMVSPDTEGKDAAGATNTADNDRGASAAAVFGAPSCRRGAKRAATGAGGSKDTVERDCSKQQQELAEGGGSGWNKGPHAAASGTRGRKRAAGGERKQAELDALASYTPLVLTRSVSGKLRSTARGINRSVPNSTAVEEDCGRKKCSDGPDPPCATGRNVRGRDPGSTTIAAGVIPKGLQLQLHVEAVAAGWNHSLLLLQDGRVLVFGDNSYGQCAQHPSVASVSSPTPLMQLPACCAIVAGQRTSAAISVSPQSTFVWGGSPVSGDALLAAAAPSGVAGEASATQQQVIPRQKQQCPTISGAASRPCVAAGDTAAAIGGGTGATATVADKNKKDVFVMSSFSATCSAAGVSSRAGSCSGPFPPRTTAFSSPCFAAASSSARSSPASPASYLAYFTPLRLKGSSLLRAPGFFEERRAAGADSGGCAATAGHEGPGAAATAEDENGWCVQPAARHCPVLRPDSVAISDSLGIAVGVDERLYAWRCRGQRPCVIRPVVAYLPTFSPSTFSAGDASRSPSCSLSSRCITSRCRGVPGRSFASTSVSTAVRRTCGIPSSSSCSSSSSPPSSASWNFTFNCRPSALPPALSLTEDSTCSVQGMSAAAAGKTMARRQAGAVVDAVESVAPLGEETVAALRTSSPPSSFSCPCAHAAVQQRMDVLFLQPPCRIRQLVVTSTRVYLLTQDGLLFSTTPPSDAAECAAIAGASASATDSRFSPSCCTALLKPLQQQQNDQRQEVPQQQRLPGKQQQQQNQKQVQRSQLQQQQEQLLLGKNHTLEGCADRDREPEYFSFCFHPVPGLASVQQISGSDTHAAAVVAMYSPSFPPSLGNLPSNRSSACVGCVGSSLSASPAAFRLPGTAATDISTAFASHAARPPRLPASSGAFSQSPTSAATHGAQVEPRSSGAGSALAPAAEPAAATSASTADSLTSHGNSPSAVNARTRLPPGATSSGSPVRAADRLPHTTRASSPCAPPAAAVDASLHAQSLAAGGVARCAAGWPAGSTAGASAPPPTSVASEGRLRAGAASLPSADLFVAGVGRPSDVLLEPGVPSASVFAITSADVAACTAAAPSGVTYAAAAVARSPSTSGDAVASAARAGTPPSSASIPSSPGNSGIDSHRSAGTETTAVASATPPSLGAFAARALLRVKSPLPPSPSFLLYTVAPAALCVRDKSLYDFCCLYLLFNLPFVLAALGGATLPPPLPAAPPLLTETKVDAKLAAGGKAVCCCCSSSTGRCSSSSSIFSNRSATDTCRSTHSSSSSSSTTIITSDSSGTNVTVNHSHTCAVGGEIIGQSQLMESHRRDPRHLPAAVGMQYLLRGLAELLVCRCDGPLPGSHLCGGKCRAAGPSWCCFICRCCSTQPELQHEAEVDAADGRYDTSAAVTRRRSLPQRHQRAFLGAAALSVGNEEIRDPPGTTQGTAEAPAHAGGSLVVSMPPRALSLAAAARQRGWWEDDGSEDEIAEAGGVGVRFTTEYHVDRMYNGDRSQTVAQVSQARNIGAPARDAAKEGWVAEETAMLRVLRTAATDFLRSYVYLAVSSRRAMTEDDAVDAEGSRRSVQVFTNAGPLYEHPQLLQQESEALQQQIQEEEQLREFFAGRLSAAGAAERLVERLKRQPLLYLLQRRASVLMERWGSSASKSDMQQAAQSGCSCHDAYERQLLSQCWPNMLWFPVCRGAAHRSLNAAVAEEHENSETTVKMKSEHKAALKAGKAKNACELDSRKKKERPTVQEKLEEDTCQVVVAKKNIDFINVAVGGTESEFGGTLAARREPIATPVPTAAAGAAAKTVSAVLSAAEEETSACRDAERGENGLALRYPLNSLSAELASRGEGGTPGAFSNLRCAAASTAITTTAASVEFPSLAAFTKRTPSRVATHRTLRRFSDAAASSGDAAARRPGRELVASAASACDTVSSAATPAASAAVGAHETPGHPSASLSFAAGPGKGRRVWGRKNQCPDGACEGDAPGGAAAAALPLAANSTSRAISAAPAAAGGPQGKREASLGAREISQDRKSILSAGETCSAAAWQQVWSRRKQQKKERCACSNTAERETAAPVSRESLDTGGTQVLVNSEVTRAVHAANGRRGTVPPAAAEAAGTLGRRGGDAALVGKSGGENEDRCLLQHVPSARKTSGSAALYGTSGASAHAYESHAAAVCSASVPYQVTRAGSQAAAAVGVHHPQPVRRFSVSLKDFLMLPPQSKGRKYKAGKGGRGKELKTEERSENADDAAPSQADGKVAGTAELAQKAAGRRWGQGIMAKKTEDGAKSNTRRGSYSDHSTSGSSTGHGSSSGRNNSSNSASSSSTSTISSSSSSSSSTSINGSNSSGSNSNSFGSKSSSGTCGGRSTGKPEENTGKRGENHVSPKPQSLAEVMREEEELQRQKQLKRQRQLQRELQHLAAGAAATRGTEQPALVLRFRGCSQGITALATSTKEHKGKGGESKPTTKTAQILLQQAATATDDASGSTAAPCHLRGNDGIGNASSCCSAGNGGRGNNSSSTSTGSSATGNTSGSNSNTCVNNNNSRKMYGPKRSSCVIENEGCLDAVMNCSMWKLAPAVSRSTPLRCGASFNCWGLEAALRAQGEGAVDLVQVQQQQLQEQLAQQRQRDEEADLQEALWLISKMEERENKEAARLEMESRRAAAATPDAPLEAPPTPSAATLAGGGAAGRGGNAGVAAEFSSLRNAASNGETTSHVLSTAAPEKPHTQRTSEMYNSRLNILGVYDARQRQCPTARQRKEHGQRYWQHRKPSQDQTRYREEDKLPHCPSSHQQQCHQESAEAMKNELRFQQYHRARRDWSPAEQQRYPWQTPCMQRESYARQQLRNVQQGEHAQQQAPKQDRVQRQRVGQENVQQQQKPLREQRCMQPRPYKPQHQQRQRAHQHMPPQSWQPEQLRGAAETQKSHIEAAEGETFVFEQQQ